jgi:hypothetical protein
MVAPQVETWWVPWGLHLLGRLKSDKVRSEDSKATC